MRSGCYPVISKGNVQVMHTKFYWSKSTEKILPSKYTYSSRS